LHDHPALAAAAANGLVLPLFVLDERLTRQSANRTTFLLDALEDLHESLESRGAPLVVRRGNPVAETLALARETGAEAIHLSADVGAYGRAREQRLRREAEAEVRAFPGVTVVPPGAITPADSDHYRVFTPYWRRWSKARLRPLAQTPDRLDAPAGIDSGDLPTLPELTHASRSPRLPKGGETAAHARLEAFRPRVAEYERMRHRLDEDGTSRLSPYLRFGCISPRMLLAELPPADELARQLCWRDFFAQLLRVHPRLRSEGLHDRGDWERDPDGLERWRSGETGEPVVDAAMRQLKEEGWMSNRARLIAAGYLTKTLGIDWREGERHFFELLVDGDPANNSGNWQWVAGVGVDTRPRGFNAARQAERFDPGGRYASRWAAATGPSEIQLPLSESASD
jgi:deoxyribodipyrimidine photo-lyase